MARSGCQGAFQLKELLLTDEGRVSSDRGVYPMDTAVLRAWARLMHGRSDTLADDARIAATAMVHNLIVVTRNAHDFQPFAVPTLNPFHTSRSER